MRPPRIRPGGWVDDRWRHLAAQRTRAADLTTAVADQEDDTEPCAECGGSGSCPFPSYCWSGVPDEDAASRLRERTQG